MYSSYGARVYVTNSSSCFLPHVRIYAFLRAYLLHRTCIAASSFHRTIFDAVSDKLAIVGEAIIVATDDSCLYRFFQQLSGNLSAAVMPEREKAKLRSSKHC